MAADAPPTFEMTALWVDTSQVSPLHLTKWKLGLAAQLGIPKNRYAAEEKELSCSVLASSEAMYLLSVSCANLDFVTIS